MDLLRRLSCLLLLAFAAPLLAASPPPAATRLTFHGTDYLHRWSKNGLNEYTPAGQEDLGKWQDMVSVVVHPQVGNGEQLANLANAVLSNYQGAGSILRTDSKPRTPQAEAEHFIAAILGAPRMAEAVFARVVLVDGQGVVVVVSRRAYGPQAAETVGKWVQAHGAGIEAALMGWQAVPRPAALATLPQAKE